MSHKRKVLVLGATGFVGRHLTISLVSQGFLPIITYRSQSGLDNAISFWKKHLNSEFENIEILHDAEVEHFVCHQNSIELFACVNLMGNSVDNFFIDNIQSANRVVKIFETIKGNWNNCCNYHVSTIATRRDKNLSLYAQSKLIGEQIVASSRAYDFVVYHSIIDSNKDKISNDIEKMLPIFMLSNQLIDDVKLTTLSIDYLTMALTFHLSIFRSKQGKQLIILQKEVSLRNFIESVLEVKLNCIEDRDLNELREKIPLLMLPSKLKDRLENFIFLANIKDPYWRFKKNHYFSFGTIKMVKNKAQYIGELNAQQELRRFLDMEFIVPI